MDGALAIAVDRERVFAAGTAGNFDFLVRAYNSKSGTLLWEDQFDKAGVGAACSSPGPSYDLQVRRGH